MGQIVGGCNSRRSARVVQHTGVPQHACVAWLEANAARSYAGAGHPMAGPVCISAPAAVVTILVVSTSERHPFRVAEHMSLCCCLRHVDGLQVRVNVASLFGLSKQVQLFWGGRHPRHNRLCKHSAASMCGAQVSAANPFSTNRKAPRARNQADRADRRFSNPLLLAACRWMSRLCAAPGRARKPLAHHLTRRRLRLYGHEPDRYR
jgi:hypothetical protein